MLGVPSIRGLQFHHQKRFLFLQKFFSTENKNHIHRTLRSANWGVMGVAGTACVAWATCRYRKYSQQLYMQEVVEKMNQVENKKNLNKEEVLNSLKDIDEFGR